MITGVGGVAGFGDFSSPYASMAVAASQQSTPIDRLSSVGLGQSPGAESIRVGGYNANAAVFTPIVRGHTVDMYV